MKIALSGKMGSGKSTTLQELAKPLSFKGVSIGSEIKPLANLLIENRSKFEQQIIRVIPDSSQREQPLREIAEYFDAHFQHAPWEKDEKGQYIKNPPYRKLLQDFPMLVRQHFGEEIFAKLLLATLKSDIEQGKSVICDDLRLPSEKALFEENGFLVIRFDISEKEQHQRLMETYGSYDEKALSHRTEVALDDATFDFRTNVTGKPASAIAQEVLDYLNSVEKHEIV